MSVDDSTASPEEPASSPEGAEAAPPSRRTAIQLLTGFLGLLLNVVPVTLGGLFFLDPLIRRRSGGEGDSEAGNTDFIRLNIGTDAVPDDGTPVAVTVIADLTDAWNKYKDVPIGSIWLRRTPEGRVLAFNSTCPHLGCSVDYRAGNNDFYCPCHTSAFDLDGTPRNEIPPRAMDELEVFTATNGERDDSGTELWVKFQEFRGGTDQKIEV